MDVKDKGQIVAIGNFDGVHRGHAALAKTARRLVAEIGDAPCCALTFEPHPRKFFRPEAPLFRLTNPAARQARLHAIGFDRVETLVFDAALAGMEAEAFVQEILCRRLRARAIVVGADFHFGRGRAGTPDFLIASGARHGFAVSLVPPFLDANGTVISSSAIRAALAAGETRRANAMLGYAFEIAGPVIHGEKRGRNLGYPTANIRLDPECGLAHGIYAVRVAGAGAAHTGVASFGRRPTFDNGAPLLEVHLFDFSGDLYGATLHIGFVEYLRAEAKFEGLDALIRQMDADSAAARAILAEKPKN